MLSFAISPNHVITHFPTFHKLSTTRTTTLTRRFKNDHYHVMTKKKRIPVSISYDNVYYYECLKQSDDINDSNNVSLSQSSSSSSPSKNDNNEKEEQVAAFILSHFEAQDFLKLKSQVPTNDNDETTIEIIGKFSVNLGMNTLTSVNLSSYGLFLLCSSSSSSSSSCYICWKDLKRISKKNRPGAFEIFHNTLTSSSSSSSSSSLPPRRITAYSETTGFVCSLLPILPYKAPTLVLSGFSMHRMTKGMDPINDTIEKLKCLNFSKGKENLKVLDICTGLGYTALYVSKYENVCNVISIEKDPMVLDMIKVNPWSKEILQNEKVNISIGCAEQLVQTKFCVAEQFHIIIHDPPAHVIASTLYTQQFYHDLYNILKKNDGQLFHYVGDPSSKESGRLYNGIIKRLEIAKFKQIQIIKSAFGIKAIKI